MINPEIKPTGCCPPFDPEPWQDKEIVWQDQLFVKDRVACFFHVPMNMGRRVVANMQRIEAADAKPEVQLMLTDCASPWRMDMYIGVSKDIPGARMTKLSGRFLTRVFDGPYQNVGKWMCEMKEHVKSQGRKLTKLYSSYTTCPRCAKAYGHNYVILFAQTE
jgi:hypothetical protein